MKYVQRIFILLCLALPLGLMAQSKIVGDWQTKIPAEDGSMMVLKVTMSANGAYAVDFGADGTIEINGKYEVSDGQMTIRDSGGPNACSGKGVYRVEVSDSAMTMTRVSDECEGRGGPEGIMAWTKR